MTVDISTHHMQKLVPGATTTDALAHASLKPTSSLPQPAHQSETNFFVANSASTPHSNGSYRLLMTAGLKLLAANREYSDAPCPVLAGHKLLSCNHVVSRTGHVLSPTKQASGRACPAWPSRICPDGWESCSITCCTLL